MAGPAGLAQVSAVSIPPLACCSFPPLPSCLASGITIHCDVHYKRQHVVLNRNATCASTLLQMYTEVGRADLAPGGFGGLGFGPGGLGVGGEMGGNLLGPRHPGFGTTHLNPPLCCLLNVSAMSTQRFPPVESLHWCAVSNTRQPTCPDPPARWLPSAKNLTLSLSHAHARSLSSRQAAALAGWAGWAEWAGWAGWAGWRIRPARGSIPSALLAWGAWAALGPRAFPAWVGRAGRVNFLKTTSSGRRGAATTCSCDCRVKGRRPRSVCKLGGPGVPLYLSVQEPKSLGCRNMLRKYFPLRLARSHAIPRNTSQYLETVTTRKRKGGLKKV